MSRKQRSRSTSSADAGRAAEAGDRPLLCPACGRPHPAEERLCSRCGMPLVIAAGDRGDASRGEETEAPRSDAHARARKIRPELTRGQLVRVAGGRNQAEAELIQGLLLEEGIPSLVRRAAAFDVPDFLAAGQRDVLVPESGAAMARELLAEARLVERAAADAAPVQATHVVRLVAAVTAGALLAASLAWVIVAASS